MNAALPIYDQALALHPNRKSLKFPLQNLFNEYVDCCLVIMKEFSQNPIKNLLRRMYSSKLQRSIEKATKNIEKQHRLFFQAIDQADREAVATQEILNTRALGQIRAAVMSNGVSVSSLAREAPRRSFSKAGEGTRPRLTTITARPNPSFVGREEETRRIHDYFTSRQASWGEGPGCVVIHGLGGQGKTQTALHYYWQYRDAYDAAFLVRSETAEQLEAGFLAIAKKLRAANLLGSSLPPSPDSEVAWEVENARDWLEGTNKKWLLIFDNLEDGRLLETYIPENFHGGSILITTQHAHISAVTNNFYKLELQPLPTKAGSRLLFKILERGPKNEEEETTAHEICTWVGGLPLAIVTVAGYLKCSASSAAEILASLRRSSTVWASSGVGAIRNYDKTLATVFDLALGKLGEHSRHFLQILAFLSPDGIPEDMLRQPHTLPSLSFLNDEDEYLRIRQDLGLRQLIKRQPSEGTSDGGKPHHQLEIHRSLQMTLLLGLATDADPCLRTDVFSEVTVMLAAVVPQASRLAQNEKDLWPAFFRYVPQVLALRQNSQWPVPPIDLDLTFVKILINIGTFLWHTGQIRECDSAMGTAEDVIARQKAEIRQSSECECLMSDMYLVTGILADCIGVSRRRESLEHRRILLGLREREFNAIPKARVTVEDEIRVGNAKGDLACAYLQRGEFGKARAIMEGLYRECYKRWGTEEEYPYEYSKYYHHLGHILMAEGKPDMALAFSRKGMKLDADHADGVDSTVLIDQYDLACLLFNAGRLEESLAEHKEVLAKRIQICGKSSQFTLESHEAVGILLHLMGSNVDAEREFKTCLQRQYKANWTVEGVARAQYWYSRVLEALDKPKEAARELRSAKLVKDKYLEEFSEFLNQDKDNEAAVYDQMVPIWVLQTSGPLHEGGRGAKLPDSGSSTM
ncbi:P-loop containing nucleoside triphosphate hydrolase protein [Lasiosphaeris hirsuta]|uniref:P-loop containing nucleoside triphosphate hydrolase protein n=1 Tax=Lasiosphaeris hirsuta TaxID=260670 RepID=A0AA40BD26_9PEZI|nr:P-loop containing nucleoside triphosphate hydrolase protein [Lasiosphaeris hirsuta]